jgi:peptide/nickel transport system substrate-binding protein
MRKIFFVALAIALLVAPILAVAQEPSGPVIEGNFGGSANLSSLNPLRSNDSAANRVTALMFPQLVGANLKTGGFAMYGEENTTTGILGISYEVSEDGTVYTFKMREDALWTDGTPITATDVKFSFDAIASGVIESPLYGFYNYVEGNEIGIKEVKIIDDYTLEFTYQQGSCLALGRAGFIVIPAHAFGYDGSPDFDFAVMVDHEYDLNPDPVYGPFKVANVTPGEAIGLVPVEGWHEGPITEVVPAGFVYRDVPDQTVLVEQFLAGETNYVTAPPVGRRNDIRTDPDVQAKDFKEGTQWDYISLNQADPNNPQPGRDADGNLIDQGHHPIFGDVRVRRALQHALNVQEIITGAVFGEGTQMPSSLGAGSWAFDETLEPIPFDLDQARALLDEAGWVSTGDPLVDGGDGLRTCQGCLYAEEGTPFEFELLTNQGNTRKEAMGLIVKDSLAKLGIVVNFEAIDFFLMLDTVYTQAYDAHIGTWGAAFPDDPDQLQLFSSSGDDPANQSSNGTSYYSEEFEKLSLEAVQPAICNDLEARAEIYRQIQGILQEDQPYIWLFSQNAFIAAAANVENFDPHPYIDLAGVESWFVPSAN